jgi:hypothetical protein
VHLALPDPKPGFYILPLPEETANWGDLALEMPGQPCRVRDLFFAARHANEKQEVKRAMAVEQPSTPGKKPAKKKSSPRKKVPTASAVASAGSQAAPKKKTAGKPAATPSASPSRRAVSPEERYRRIQDAAYFKAEKNGFSGDPSAYWAEAEAEVDRQLSG